MTTSVKFAGISKTLIGVLIAAAGVVVQQPDLLRQSLGTHWGGVAITAAGFVLAVYGRVKADSQLALTPGRAKRARSRGGKS